MPRQSLGTRFALLLALFVVPMLGILLYNASVDYRLDVQESKNDLLRTVRLVSFEQQRLFEETRLFLNLLAHLPVVRERNSTACNALFADFLRRYSTYSGVAAAAPDGEIFCSAVPAATANISDRASFKRAMQTRQFAVGDYRAGRTSGKPRLSFGYPVLDGTGRVLAVVVTGVDLVAVNKAMTKADLHPGTTIVVIDRTGNVLAGFPDPEKWIGASASNTPQFRAILSHHGEGTIEVPGPDGVVRLSGFTRMQGLPQDQDWYVSMTVPGRPLIDASVKRNLIDFGVLGAIGFAVTWLGIAQYIVRPITIFIRATKQLAAGHLSQRVQTGSLAEINALAEAFNTMADRLAVQARERALLNDMGDFLQACNTVKDACAVTARFVGQLFPASSGAVFLFHPSRDLLEGAVAWGADGAGYERGVFPPGDCWALQRGQEHVVDDTAAEIVCAHLKDPLPAVSLCLPLIAQGDIVGVLHLADYAPDPRVPSAIVSGRGRELAKAIAERVGLAIANLRLRETLRSQSIRDPLTGLFNRRYLEETLERELRRAERAHRPIGILMFDIDHFKQFNDTFGHEAGDVVLREVGVLLRTRFRGEDIACRYGGEELVVILPDASLDHTRARAEELREVVKHLHVSLRGRTLGSVTFSFGISVFPADGATSDAVLRAADEALYRAKQSGRDRIEAAGSPESLDTGVGHPT